MNLSRPLWPVGSIDISSYDGRLVAIHFSIFSRASSSRLEKNLFVYFPQLGFIFSMIHMTGVKNLESRNSSHLKPGRARNILPGEFTNLRGVLL